VPYDLRARPIQPADEAVCRGIDCGAEPYQRVLTDFLRTKYWRGRPTEEHTIISFTVETDELVGYATWKVRTDVKLEGEDEERTVIDIPYFGLDTKFQGEVDHDGNKLAGRLLATVDAVARREANVTNETPMHLVVEPENVRAYRFWCGRGFRDVQRLEFPDVTYIRMLRP
jgi:ribosomal protein S18 acetylase RimI-like enzyme